MSTIISSDRNSRDESERDDKNMMIFQLNQTDPQLERRERKIRKVRQIKHTIHCTTLISKF